MRRNTTKDSGPFNAEAHTSRLVESWARENAAPITYQYFTLVSKRAAMILQVVVDAMQFEGHRFPSMWREGAFLVTTEFLQQKLGLDRGAQDRYLAELKRKGFVQTVRYGLPARRYVKVDFAAIERAVGQWDEKWAAIRTKRVEIRLPDTTAILGQDGDTK